MLRVSRFEKGRLKVHIDVVFVVFHKGFRRCFTASIISNMSDDLRSAMTEGPRLLHALLFKDFPIVIVFINFLGNIFRVP